MSRQELIRCCPSATTGGRASSGLQETGVRNDINFAKQQQPVSYVDDLVVLEDAFEDVFKISSDLAQEKVTNMDCVPLSSKEFRLLIWYTLLLLSTTDNTSILDNTDTDPDGDDTDTLEGRNGTLRGDNISDITTKGVDF